MKTDPQVRLSMIKALGCVKKDDSVNGEDYLLMALRRAPVKLKTVLQSALDECRTGSLVESATILERELEGMIPPDPEEKNDDRAKWAHAALDVFMAQTGADPEDAVADLLTDLRHWCDRNQTSFLNELRRADNNYDEETRNP